MPSRTKPRTLFHLIAPADDGDTDRFIAEHLGPEADGHRKDDILFVRLDGLESRVSGWALGREHFEHVRRMAASRSLSFRVFAVYEGQGHAVFWKTMWSNGKSWTYKDPDA